MEAYREQALDDEEVPRRKYMEVFASLDNSNANPKENRKFYPGLEELEFRLYTFHSLNQNQ